MGEKPCVFLLPVQPMVLVPWPSGVLFEVEANGMFISHLQIEGICLPIGQGANLEPHLFELHPGCISRHEGLDPDVQILLTEDGLNQEEADAIDSLFQQYHLPLLVNRARCKESCEAWVHIQIVKPNDDFMLHAFEGREAILTWSNCD